MVLGQMVIRAEIPATVGAPEGKNHILAADLALDHAKHLDGPCVPSEMGYDLDIL